MQRNDDIFTQERNEPAEVPTPREDDPATPVEDEGGNDDEDAATEQPVTAVEAAPASTENGKRGRKAGRPDLGTIEFGAHIKSIMLTDKAPRIVLEAELSPDKVADLYRARRSGRIETTLRVTQGELPLNGERADAVYDAPPKRMCTCAHRLEAHAGKAHDGKCLATKAAVGDGPCPCVKFEEQPALPIDETKRRRRRKGAPKMKMRSAKPARDKVTARPKGRGRRRGR